MIAQRSSVALASTLQFLVAEAFLLQAVAAYLYGAAAQRAAEADVVEQGFPAGVLAQRGVNFNESGVEMLLPVAIAVCLATLASLNLAGIEAGRVLTWIVQPILLVAGGIVTARQVFAVRQLEAAFKKSGDATLQGIDLERFMDAALDAFPAGFRYLVAARFVLTTVGSLLVILLLALPSADADFA